MKLIQLKNMFLFNGKQESAKSMINQQVSSRLKASECGDKSVLVRDTYSTFYKVTRSDLQ